MKKLITVLALIGLLSPVCVEQTKQATLATMPHNNFTVLVIDCELNGYSESWAYSWKTHELYHQDFYDLKQIWHYPYEK